MDSQTRNPQQSPACAALLCHTSAMLFATGGASCRPPDHKALLPVLQGGHNPGQVQAVSRLSLELVLHPCCCTHHGVGILCHHTLCRTHHHHTQIHMCYAHHSLLRHNWLHHCSPALEDSHPCRDHKRLGPPECNLCNKENTVPQQHAEEV